MHLLDRQYQQWVEDAIAFSTHLQLTKHKLAGITSIQTTRLNARK